MVKAYWIAFGPHGARAGSPPGEGRTIVIYTTIGVAISVGLFGFTRYFARPPPHTMTKEYQEKSDEYLKVIIAYTISVIRMTVLTLGVSGTKRGANHRYLVRGIQRWLHGAEPTSSQEIDQSIDCAVTMYVWAQAHGMRYHMIEQCIIVDGTLPVL